MALPFWAPGRTLLSRALDTYGPSCARRDVCLVSAHVCHYYTGANLWPVAERVRIVPSMVFILVWTTVVYDVVAYWTWAARGWLHNLSCLGTILTAVPCEIGAYDFAGGGPVHIASGFAGLAFCLFVGRRAHVREHVPHNLSNVFFATGLLWLGWLAFNGGANVAPTARAGMATFNSMLAPSVSALTWVFTVCLFLFDLVSALLSRVAKKILQYWERCLVSRSAPAWWQAWLLSRLGLGLCLPGLLSSWGLSVVRLQTVGACFFDLEKLCS